jgi:1,4-alpha-glucan branching enzyme
MVAHLLDLKRTCFLLWRPAVTALPPEVVYGTFQDGNPPIFNRIGNRPMAEIVNRPGLWAADPAGFGLANDTVYHYWFEITDSDPRRPNRQRMWVTDPTAWSVDWRLLAPLPPGGDYSQEDRDPAGVVKWRGDQLVPCDPGGEEPIYADPPPFMNLRRNNRLVIYQLPTALARSSGPEGFGFVIGVGTFRDVRALVDPAASPVTFSGVAAFEGPEAYLRLLGINALELLPPADSWLEREWGYATSNYFAPDYDLGYPRGNHSPTASSDLAALVGTCHGAEIRFFTDAVMAFATHGSYESVNFPDFHVNQDARPADPEAEGRDPFGGTLFKFAYEPAEDTYDPVTGDRGRHYPARRFLMTHIERWIRDFRVDGIRLDSVVNYKNWDFIKQFRNHARGVWLDHATNGPGAIPAGQAEEAEARFLVFAEELGMPGRLIRERYVDGLWNEYFKRLVRSAILGRNHESEPSFEWTVRKMIDCRELVLDDGQRFQDGTEAINYVTSHDVQEGPRLYTLLGWEGVQDQEDRVKRIELAFACLFTAVGIPMIFAGEEFADEHDLLPTHPQKQVDPVNYDRWEEPWRRNLFNRIARLVKLRTSSVALSVNDTEFIHADFDNGKRVVAWLRGRPADDPVVVVANFSDWGTADPMSGTAEYRVPNWPATPPGRSWREVIRNRQVPLVWIGREPLFPWEAKVYTLD